MGLFNANFSKEGPGVSKDALEKNRFFLFFEILGRKFSNLIPTNIIYFITLLPVIAGVLLSVRLNPQLFDDLSSSGPLFVFTGDIIGLAILFVSLFITGPATCAFTYVLRNMQRQEHTWIFSDFKDQFKKNYKQGLCMSIIDVIIPFILYIAFCFYKFSLPVTMPEMANLGTVLQYVIISLSIVFIMMHYYIYTMIVTFDLKFKDIIKNSIIFTFAKLPLNIFISLIIAGVIALSLWFLLVGLILSSMFTLSFLGFFIIYCIYPTIEKSMINPQEHEEEAHENNFKESE